MLTPRMYRFDVVDSTNEVALEMARRDEPAGTVVTSDHQLRGRGRRGNPWWDQPGESVIISVILNAPAELSQLAFVASLAVADALAAHALDVALKWPNDVLIGGRKVAGILVEAAGKSAVVGIGLNVNETEFPDRIADATSLLRETGAIWCIDDVRHELMESVFAVHEEYVSLGFEEILARWRNYMCGVGSACEVEAEGGVVRGTIAGVDETGALRVADDGGVSRTVHAAESVHILEVGSK